MVTQLGEMSRIANGFRDQRHQVMAMCLMTRRITSYHLGIPTRPSRNQNREVDDQFIAPPRRSERWRRKPDRYGQNILS